MNERHTSANGKYIESSSAPGTSGTTVARRDSRNGHHVGKKGELPNAVDRKLYGSLREHDNRR